MILCGVRAVVRSKGNCREILKNVNFHLKHICVSCIIYIQKHIKIASWILGTIP
jgi:hypothetical protein